MSAGLSIDASVVVGDFRAEYDLQVHAGEVLAVLGPNGAGKSTLLRAVAGLVPLTRGRLRLGGRLADEAPGGARLSVRERALGVVFQDYLLFRHLTALDNVGFGLRARGATRMEARAAASEWLARLGIGDLSARRPEELSGGQAQKVALARALATSPDVLLLDEPLSALDVESRSEVRAELRSVLAGFEGAALVVTHDPADAAALADRIAIVEGGVVTQLGTPEALAAGPATAYVAALVGRTGFDVVLGATGTVVHEGLGEIQGIFVARAERAGATAAGDAMGAGGGNGPHATAGRMFASIRSELVEVLIPEAPGPGGADTAAAETGVNTWPATIQRLERGLGSTTATLLLGDARAPVRLTARLPLDTALGRAGGLRIPGGPHEGQSVLVCLPPSHVAFVATR